MKRFMELIRDCLTQVREIMPWDLEERLQANPDLLLVDVREPYEYDAMHIAGSLNVPRGILESACEWDYEETEPELVRARDREVVVLCRSGNRSILAAHAMQVLGYQNVVSLKTGLRGWKDYDQPLVDSAGDEVDLDDADVYFTPQLRDDQLRPRPRVEEPGA
ncbi:MAG: rhodanese-like domain-containing protein [Gammaproteobacteria bacterium]|jgi:rhodanese-related sulfurtransferase